MSVRNILVAAPVALSLMATPVLAQAVDADREAAPTEEGEEFFGFGFLISALVAVAVVTATVIIIDELDDPSSP